MSGGSFDYMYASINEKYVGFMEDTDMNEMMLDLCNLLRDLEWYKSMDTSEEDYKRSVKEFKDQWFGQRDTRLRRQLKEKVEKLLDELIDDDALDKQEVKK